MTTEGGRPPTTHTPARVAPSAPSGSTLDQRMEVETPEQVAITFTIAGLGSRAAAALVDTGICASLFALLMVLVRLLGGGSGMRGGSLSPLALTLYFVGQFAIIWGYYVLWEGLRDGQTPGKRLFGLRVVRDGGLAVDFPASVARNLLRAIDMQPGVFFGVGLVSAALSRQSRRLGDYVAGTVVVRERAPAPHDQRAPVAIPTSGAPLTTRLRDDEYELLDRLHGRRETLQPEQLTRLSATVAARLRPRAPELSEATTSDADFLARLHASEVAARERGVAARGATGARREQYALVAQGMPRWREFAALLADAQKRGLAALGEDGVTDFVARYREITAELARLHTATRGREVWAVYYLSRLAAGGHNLLYRGARAHPGAIWRYLFVAVPAEIRRAWRPILLAALLLFAPAVISFVAVVRSEAAARALVMRALVDRAETGVERARTGGGYLPEEDAAARGPILASAIATNNVRVTYTVFATGVTGGVLTVFMLVMNGVGALGAPLGYYARLGILPQIVGFVVGHGVLELAAICISGGAAFELAAGLLLPGALTRRDALVRRGRRALHLLAGTTLLLLVAGIIEGYVSPLVWPLGWKLALSATTAVALLAYLSPWRRGGSHHLEEAEQVA